MSYYWKSIFRNVFNQALFINKFPTEVWQIQIHLKLVWWTNMLDVYLFTNWWLNYFFVCVSYNDMYILSQCCTILNCCRLSVNCRYYFIPHCIAQKCLHHITFPSSLEMSTFGCGHCPPLCLWVKVVPLLSLSGGCSPCLWWNSLFLPQCSHSEMAFVLFCELSSVWPASCSLYMLCYFFLL